MLAIYLSDSDWEIPVAAKRKKTRNGPRRLAVPMLVALLSNPVSGADLVVTVDEYNPVSNDRKAGSTLVGNGGSVTLVGPARFQVGDVGYDVVTASQLLAQGRIVSGAEYIDPASPLATTLGLGAKMNISVPDPITGTRRVISVNDTRAIVPGTPSNLTAPAWYNVNGGQYIDLRAGTVEASGGRLDVNLGDASKPSTDTANTISVVAKQSALFEALGTGGADSTVTWTAPRSSIRFVSVTPPAESGDGRVQVLSQATYHGTFTAFDKSVHTVGNAEDLKVYNRWLVEQAQAGHITTQAQYDSAFAQAVTLATRDVTFSNKLDPNDEVLAPLGMAAVIHAVGARATGRVAEGAHLDARSAGRSATGPGGVLLGEDRATVINDGRISVATVGSGRIGTGISVLSGSRGINNGLINSGFFAADGNPTSEQISASLAFAAIASGADTTFENHGIINGAGNPTVGSTARVRAIQVDAGASGTNAGVLNVGVSRQLATEELDGVLAMSANFVNSGSGTIYIGRGPQYDAAHPESVADVRHDSGAALVGIFASGAAANVRNDGLIASGTLTQNVRAMQLTNGAVGENRGRIALNGSAIDKPIESVGMLVNGTTRASNTGVIDLNGVNGIGVKVLQTAATRSAAVSSGA